MLPRYLVRCSVIQLGKLEHYFLNVSWFFYVWLLLSFGDPQTGGNSLIEYFASLHTDRENKQSFLCFNNNWGHLAYFYSCKRTLPSEVRHFVWGNIIDTLEIAFKLIHVLHTSISRPYSFKFDNHDFSQLHCHTKITKSKITIYTYKCHACLTVHVRVHSDQTRLSQDHVAIKTQDLIDFYIFTGNQLWHYPCN